MGAHRNIGLFGIVELVRDRETYEPMAPYNGTSEEMAALRPVLPASRGSTPWCAGTPSTPTRPLIITEAELAQAFDIIDDALYLADEAYRG